MAEEEVVVGEDVVVDEEVVVEEEEEVQEEEVMAVAGSIDISCVGNGEDVISWSSLKLEIDPSLVLVDGTLEGVVSEAVSLFVVVVVLGLSSPVVTRVLDFVVVEEVDFFAVV